MRLPALTLAALCFASSARAEPVELAAGTYLFEFTNLQPGVGTQINHLLQTITLGSPQSRYQSQRQESFS